MKKSVRIFEIIKKKLQSKEFICTHKTCPKAFIRNRLLTFNVLFFLILNLLRNSIPKELNSFFDFFPDQKRTSRSAFSQARIKISPLAYKELNSTLVKEFYKNNDFHTYLGLIVLAIDGSTLQLPESREIIDKYGCMFNHTNKRMPGARISILYDALNNIILDALQCPYKQSEKEMVFQHIENLKLLAIDLKRIIIIFDRGYPSLALMHYLNKNGIMFLIRSGIGFLKEVKDVLTSNLKDEIVTINPKRLKGINKAKVEIAKLFPEQIHNQDIIFRVLIISLKTGEKEILLTSLLCRKRYPYDIFETFYFKRWGIEECYKLIKGIEIENFSGKSTIAVEQDFHATVFVANSHALLVLEAQEELNDLFFNEKSENIEFEDMYSEAINCKYQVNKRVSIASLKHVLVLTLLDPNSDISAFCTKIKKKMKMDLIPKRPNRTYKRLQKNTRRKYHMNQR